MVKPVWLGEEWRQEEVRASEKGGGEKDRRTEALISVLCCMSRKKKWQGWDSNPRHRNDWCLKPAP